MGRLDHARVLGASLRGGSAFPLAQLASGIAPLADPGLLRHSARPWRPRLYGPLLEAYSGPLPRYARYPFGSHLNAWAVSFGFMWLAFGLVFFLAACIAPRTKRIWFALVTAWCLAWLPHIIIGVAATVAGGNAPSIEIYRRWGSNPSGALILVKGAMVLLVHFGLSLVGFGLTARELHKSVDRGVGGSA